MVTVCSCKANWPSPRTTYLESFSIVCLPCVVVSFISRATSYRFPLLSLRNVDEFDFDPLAVFSVAVVWRSAKASDPSSPRRWTSVTLVLLSDRVTFCSSRISLPFRSVRKTVACFSVTPLPSFCSSLSTR